MLTRRSVMLGAAGTPLLRIPALAQAAEWREDLRAALSEKQLETLGAELLPPDDPLWDKAHQILVSAAAAKTPYKMAEYLSSIPDEFRREWSRRVTANPVIVLLWTATKIKKPPKGDITPWCAAFMNWCLSNANPRIAGTGSPSSQSFLHWGTEVWNKSSGKAPANAKRGDVAVFTHKSDPGHGHVTFFYGLSKDNPKYVDVLGGNQSDSFRKSSYPMSADLELVTIRTASGLRDA